MSQLQAHIANIIALVKHFAGLLSQFGDRASVVAASTLKVWKLTSPILIQVLPQLAPFSVAIQAALQIVADHGPEVANGIDEVVGVLGGLGDIVGGLNPVDPTPTPATPAA